MNLTSIKLTVNGAQAWATVTGPLTSGMVGLPVTIEYDEAWVGLTKNLVCRCSRNGSSGEEYRSILNVENTTNVAHEVMKTGMFLYLGVEGYNADGTLVIPTVWAMCGAIEKGANTGDDLSSDPTLPIWGQLQEQIAQIKQNGINLEQMDEIRTCVQKAIGAVEQASNAAQSAAISAGHAESAAARAEMAVGSSPHVSWMFITTEVENEIPCTGISLDKSALTFTGAGQQTIVATVTPADTTDTLVWTSSKPAVATVANGVVTAYANGSATITATCGGYSESCTVEVSGISSTVAVTGITLDKATATVQAGSAITLTATVKPDNATNKTVLWSSDDETVAKVVDGVVTGISEGTASIEAMTADGGFSAVCSVAVAATSNYKNLFDKDTMVVGGGIRYDGIIASNWGMAKVPVKENTVYSLKTTDATADVGYYGAPTAGSIGFADSTGNALIYNLILGDPSKAESNGINADLKEYAHGDVKGYGGNDGTVEWVTFTTPAGCAYLLFNTTLKNNVDKIQLEEGDTIHNYYLPYEGGAA